MTNYIFQNYDKNLDIGKLICLARTYKEHAIEMDSIVPIDPILFLKPESSVIFNNDSIVIPKSSSCIHHEIELGVVIGKDGKDISQEHAMDYVLGYLVALDITARDIQSIAKKNGLPWSIAKGFDTFAPISDVILKEEIKNPLNIDLKLKINGQIKQQSNTKYMIFTIERIIEYVSNTMTLRAGDLILTGTPEGVGRIVKGDVIEAYLGNYCYLKVDVKEEM